MRRSASCALFAMTTAGAAACASLYGIEETTTVSEDAGVPDAPADSIAPVDAADAADASTDADAAPQLLAWWDFDEDGGVEVRDRSSFGRHAKITGSVTRDLAKFGRGLVFDRDDAGTGTGELDCQDHAPALFGESGSLIFWWRDDDDTPAPLPRSANLFDNQTSGREHFFLSRPKDSPPQTLALSFQFVSSDAGIDDFANGAGGTPLLVKKGDWTKLAVTWTPDGGTLRVGAGAQPFTFYRRWAPSGQACFFGRHAVGAIDEVRIYDRPLTADEIAAFP